MFLKAITLIGFVLLNFVCSSGKYADNTNFNLEKDPSYPIWIKSQNDSAYQTSGIAFIKTENNIKYFIIADDIGVLHYLTVDQYNKTELQPITFSSKADSFLSSFPKKDFEEIIYDKSSHEVYLSIEGNKPDVKKYVGLYKLHFKDNHISSGIVDDIQKIEFKNEKKLLSHVKENIGFEGATFDKNYIYLALEGFQNNGLFADSTIIYIIDKQNFDIIKEINTKPYKIGSICGLYSDYENSIIGIDRNSKKVFHFILNDDLSVKNYNEINLESKIPGYSEYEYVASLESIVLDDENNLFLIDDPWPKFFRPDKSIFDKLDADTQNNFKKLVPVLFKYKVKI